MLGEFQPWTALNWLRNWLYVTDAGGSMRHLVGVESQGSPLGARRRVTCHVLTCERLTVPG